MASGVIVLGIRHHGPGSARRMLEALEQFNPDQLLIEGPCHASGLVQKKLDLVPPVSIVQMSRKARQAEGFYPFADFSPEWQAIQWAWNENKSVRFIDLPSYHPSFLEASYEADPLGQLARASGYSDTEKWWEYHFEQGESSADLFRELHTLIAQVRQSGPSSREIFMSQMIKEYRKPKIKTAVVCGAWHAPVLEDWMSVSNSAPIQAPDLCAYYWVPWTYLQLAKEKGYGAGVVAPMYYDCLWNHPEDVAAHWFVHAAGIFRKKGLDVSPAHLIEATHLSQNLASLRIREAPGLPELTDAIEAVFPPSETTRWQILRDEVWLGTKTGYVDPKVHQLPLIEDFYAQLRRFRLYTAVKNGKELEKKLDLRDERQSSLSVFFHQLLAMGLNWPNRMITEVGHLGSFNEYWHLASDFLLDAKLIEHVHKGQSVREAGLYQLRVHLSRPDTLGNILDWLGLALNGEYSEALPELIALSEQRIIEEEDGVSILSAWIQLNGIIQYGDVRSYDVGGLRKMQEYLLRKIYIHLAHSLPQVSEEAAITVAGHLKSFHQSRQWEVESWMPVLKKVSQTQQVLPALRGLCFRLFSQLSADLPQANTLLQQEFSSLSDIDSTTQWLTGFFSSGKTDFIQNTSLLSILDDWISQLSESQFDDVLIGLREAFSIFSIHEKVEIRKHRTEQSTADQNQVHEKRRSIFADLFSEIAKEDIP